jgi:hypothetical protein
MGSIRKSREERAGSQRTSAIYLIRNGKVEPDAEFFRPKDRFSGCFAIRRQMILSVD